MVAQNVTMGGGGTSNFVPGCLFLDIISGHTVPSCLSLAAHPLVAVPLYY